MGSLINAQAGWCWSEHLGQERLRTAQQASANRASHQDALLTCSRRTVGPAAGHARCARCRRHSQPRPRHRPHLQMEIRRRQAWLVAALTLGQADGEIA